MFVMVSLRTVWRGQLVASVILLLVMYTLLDNTPAKTQKSLQ